MTNAEPQLYRYFTFSQPRNAERQLRRFSCAFSLVTACIAWHRGLLCERTLGHVVTMNKISLAESGKSAVGKTQQERKGKFKLKWCIR